MKKAVDKITELGTLVMPGVRSLLVTLIGTCDMMLDRFITTDPELSKRIVPADKLYKECDYTEKSDSKVIGIPATNIMSMITSENNSAAVEVFGKKFKSSRSSLVSSFRVKEAFIPLLRNNKPIEFNGFGKGSGMYIHKGKALVRNGKLLVPVAKERPCISAPWEVKFTLVYNEFHNMPLETILDLFRYAGMNLGLGTWRREWGKFEVKVA
jgi:hypothetical protein